MVRGKEKAPPAPEPAADCVAQRDQKLKTQPKLPTMITHQVLVGLMNDIFSSCTFRTRPEVSGSVVPLSEQGPATDCQYILVLRYDKREVLYEILSSGGLSQAPGVKVTRAQEDDSRATQLSVGLTAALKATLKEPTTLSKVPIKILDGYIQKHLNRGGMWAYMSLPCFLGPSSSDSAAIKERRLNALKADMDSLRPIGASAIVSLLWAIYYLKADGMLSQVCRTLAKEYITAHSDPKKLVYVLYMGYLMGVLSPGEIAEAANARLNQVTILETLTEKELLLLLCSFDEPRALNYAVIKKAVLIIKDSVDQMHPQCVACLVWILVKLEFRFEADQFFTKNMMTRLSGTIAALPANNTYLFSALAFVPCDIGYYDAILGSITLKLHLMHQEEIILVGASYAYASRQENRQKAGEVEEARPAKIYHFLKLHVQNLLVHGLQYYEVLNDMVSPELLSDRRYHFTNKIAETNMAFPLEPISTLSKRTHIRAIPVSSVNRDASEANASYPVSKLSNTFKLFCLNLLEDACIRYEHLEFDSLCCLTYALLTFRIDVTPLHQAMLVTQGLMLHKAHNPVNIVEMTQEQVFAQYEMVYKILQYSQNPDDPESSLIIGGTELHGGSIYHDSVASTSEIEEEELEEQNGTEDLEGTFPPDVVAEEIIEDKEEHILPAKEVEPEKVVDTVPKQEQTAKSDAPFSVNPHKKTLLEVLAALTHAITRDDPEQYTQIDEVIKKYQDRLNLPQGESDTNADAVKETRQVSSEKKQGAPEAKNNSKSSTRICYKDSSDQTSTPKSASKKKKTKAETLLASSVSMPQHTEEVYRIMFKIRATKNHMATLVKRRVAISYTYVKVKGASRWER